MTTFAALLLNISAYSLNFVICIVTEAVQGLMVFILEFNATTGSELLYLIWYGRVISSLLHDRIASKKASFEKDGKILTMEKEVVVITSTCMKSSHNYYKMKIHKTKEREKHS